LKWIAYRKVKKAGKYGKRNKAPTESGRVRGRDGKGGPATLSLGRLAKLRRVRLAEFGVPIKTDSRIVPRAAYFVGIFAIVRFGREVDEENFIGGDSFEAVKDSRRNMDEDPMMFADDNAVGLSVGRAFWSGIVEADFGHSVNDRHAVGLFFVCVPGFDDAWVDGAEVGLAEANKVGVVFSEDFHDAASVIAVLREGQEFEAVDHGVSMEDWQGVERLRCGALLRPACAGLRRAPGAGGKLGPWRKAEET